MTPIEEERWPLDGIKLTALLKVVEIEIFYHDYANYDMAEEHGEPYTQISLNGFVLFDAQGGVLYANVQINEEYGFTEKVQKIKESFSPGSIHWIESDSFMYGDREILFLEPQARPLPKADYDAVDAFFPILVEGREEPSAQEFYYSGGVYREGRGKFLGYSRSV